MATRKKKVKEEILVAASTKTYPSVTVGSHLIVTEYEDGRTSLVWDDEALARDVREAIASVENKKYK